MKLVSLRLFVCALSTMSFALLCAGQEPATPQATPQQATPQPAAKPAATTTPKDTGGDMDREDLSIGLSYWYNPAAFHLRNGKGATVGDNPANLDYGGKNQPTPGIEVRFPAGRYNALSFSYFRTHGSHGTTTPVNIKAFGQDYNAKDILSTAYTLQSAKASWEYLSWPFPPKDRKFRLKTLWEVQFINVKSTIDAPLVDFINTTSELATKSTWFIYPTLGLGIEERFSPNVKWELKGSGFALPHRAVLYDASTDFAIRRGKLEILIGGRIYHFKTSPQKSEYVYATLPGAFLELRWHSTHGQ